MPDISPHKLHVSHPGTWVIVALAAGLLAATAFFISSKSVAFAYDLDENNCLACHSNPTLTTKNGQGVTISLYVSAADLTRSAHRYVDCSTCHSSKPHQTPTPLTKLSLAQKCGTCHQYELKLHLTSIHGSQLLKGNPDVASCADCHSTNSNPHSIVRVLEPTASAYPKNIAQTCARCHGDPQLMARYGIVEKVYESYMRSFHGKAIALAPDIAVQLNKATCVSCHGTHDIKAVDDPAAPVAGMANLAKTCEQCHPGAGVAFASGFLGHREANPTHLPPVYWGERFFFWFTTIVLAMGALLILFEIGRWLAGKVMREDERQ
ncbi:MAG: cytochrome c3 family protein [Chloroflexota bacterium]